MLVCAIKNPIPIWLFKVKSAVEDKVGKKLDTYTSVSYKTQVVAGTNYFVKVRIKAKNVL